MLTDFGALTLAWFGFRLARRPADWRRTYGFDRFQVLVAFANGLGSVRDRRLDHLRSHRTPFAAPRPVEGGLMVVVAVLGLLVNVGAFRLLHGADREESQRQRRDRACARRSPRLGGGADRRRRDPLRPAGRRSIRFYRSSSRSSSLRAAGGSSAKPATSCSRARRTSSTRAASRPISSTTSKASRACIMCMCGRSRRSAAW